MALMVSISGIRGIVGSTLTPEVIVRYASAFAEYCSRGTIVIGRDGRVTGKPIAHLVASTLVSMGCDVAAIGICPTPTVQIGVETLGAAGGISVTASHNPMIWNGLKFLAPTGLFLDAEENEAFWRIADKPGRTYAAWDQLGTHRAMPELLDRHLEMVLSLPYVDVEALRKRQFKVVVDCVNAAGGIVVPRLLRELGCRVVEMNCDVSGVFAHTPEPLPENLTDLARRVKEEGADLGIAVDPDVDRLVLIDEQGEPFGEEYTIASVVQFVLSREAKSSPPSSLPRVVVNLSTTRAVDDIAARFGAQVIRTPVGEINVARKMKEVGALIGGEGSGGVILPKVHLGRDALVGIGLALQHLLEFGGTLSALKASLPGYTIVKDKVDVTGIDAGWVLRRIEEQQTGKGSIVKDDGLKIDYPDSWVHLRKSNTEPIIRIIAEAPARSKADELVSRFTALIRHP